MDFVFHVTLITILCLVSFSAAANPEASIHGAGERDGVHLMTHHEEDDGHHNGRENIQVFGKKCRQHLVKPTAARAKVDQNCQNKFPESPLCSRLCRLENLKVIKNGRVQEKAWRSYIEYSYPTEVIPDLLPMFVECGHHYVHGTGSTSDHHCEENEEFLNCLRDAADAVCETTPSK